jgi:hypothetical protein
MGFWGARIGNNFYMTANINDNDLVYNIIFDIPKDGQIEVSKFIEGMKDCLMALEEINHAIIGGIDSSIEVVSYIQALQGGSVIYKLKEVVKQGPEIAIATAFAVNGDYGLAVELCLKGAKNIFFEINNQRLEKKEKEKTICEAIKQYVENSGLSNELKGYYLDEKRLIKAAKHFASGVKKTNNNVFYQQNDTTERIQIDSSIADIAGEEEDFDPEKQEPSYVNGHIIIYAPVLDRDQKKQKWKFKYNNRIESIDITKSDIAQRIFARGKIVIGDTFKVKMEVIENQTNKGYKNEYKVIEVLEFKEGEEQGIF